MTEQFLTFNNKKLAYTIHGSGPAVMLIHGYTESKDIWFPMAEKLEKKYMVIMPDLPGHGNSDVIENLTMEIMAKQMDVLADKLQLERFTMIGHSMGGYMTACYASLNERRLNGFGFFHSSARGDTAEGKSNRDRVMEIIEKDHGDTFINMFVPSLFYEANRDRLESEIKTLQQRALKISKKALIECQKAMAARMGHIDLIADSNLPILYIIGKQDSRSDYNLILAQAALAKRAFVLSLDSCGHMGYLEKFDDCLAAVEGFLMACLQTNDSMTAIGGR
ncbi:MAG: alpha/beta fold hydrolase [Bacteroidales bacterium]|jgi:pimeloyl-ACP methyl ester carboxylesterase|nr:alpha/beta hydrolase [Bacteroidales bacterium]